MSSRSVDFVIGSSPVVRKKKSKEFNLCYAYPIIEKNVEVDSIVRNDHVNPQSSCNDEELINDGLYVSPEGPLKSNIVKPYSLASLRKIVVESFPIEPRTKLFEIAVREVKIHQSFNGSQSPIEIVSVSIMFNDKVICKSSSPFNRKLNKLLFSSTLETNDLSIRVQSRDSNFATLPLPLPQISVNDKRLEIDFSIRDTTGRIHSGTVVCTVTLKIQNSESFEKSSPEMLSISNNSNIARNLLAGIHPKTIETRNERVGYFLLNDPALCLENVPGQVSAKSKKKEVTKPPDIVVSEQPSLSIVGLSLGKWFQARRPLRPSSATNTHKLRTGREEIVTITILRGVEVPVREESALVQPMIEIHWGKVSRLTSVVNGPAPVWQETVEFEVSRHSTEQFVKLSLYDQHPIWGLQWLGDATIPLEFHRNYQEFERWIGLSSLLSPVLRFGYVQASPVRSHTRIYILMKMERPGNIVKSSEIHSSDLIAKSIQRCMTIPYKIPGTESLDDCATLAMLLNPLPSHYGPLTPRQALKLNKIDDYGRAALLATLLQGFGLDAYVLIGSSQARKLAAFVVSFDENGTSSFLWDPENGEHYDFGDIRCSLIKASRMINHQNIWKNIQKSTTVPFNLRLNPKSNKDWQALPNATSSTAGTTSTSREVQILEFDGTTEEDVEFHLEIERNLREKLSQWRSNISLTTIFNRHAVTILRSYLGKFKNRTDPQPDKKELRQLYRAYHIHGFILNLRYDSQNDLADQLFSTKIHAITGPIEFALVSRIQKHIARTCSIWLAVVVLRNRD